MSCIQVYLFFIAVNNALCLKEITAPRATDHTKIFDRQPTLLLIDCETGTNITCTPLNFNGVTATGIGFNVTGSTTVKPKKVGSAYLVEFSDLKTDSYYANVTLSFSSPDLHEEVSFCVIHFLQINQFTSTFFYIFVTTQSEDDW